MFSDSPFGTFAVVIPSIKKLKSISKLLNWNEKWVVKYTPSYNWNNNVSAAYVCELFLHPTTCHRLCTEGSESVSSRQRVIRAAAWPHPIYARLTYLLDLKCTNILYLFRSIKSELGVSYNIILNYIEESTASSAMQLLGATKPLLEN